MLASQRAARFGARHILRRARTTPSLSLAYSSEATSQSTPTPTTTATTTPEKPTADSKPVPEKKPAARSSSRTIAPPRPANTMYQPKPAARLPTSDNNSYKSSAAAAADTALAKGNGWMTGFYGVGERPVTEEQFQLLAKPLDVAEIEVKPDGVMYLPEIKYRRRLNETFGPMGWGLIPRGEPIVGDAIVTREYALVVGGRFASQSQGENSYFNPEGIPSAVEGCKSNALMRCCKDLGIGSELWDPHFVRWFKKTHMEAAWVEHVVTKKKRQLWFRRGQVEAVYPYRLSGASNSN